MKKCQNNIQITGFDVLLWYWERSDETPVFFFCHFYHRGGQGGNHKDCLFVIYKRTDEMSNVRYSNGNLRRKHRARLKAMGGPCGICRGRLGPIHYDEPSDSKHPLSFVIDEIRPVSRWKEFGYESARAAVQDWNNLQPAHYCCNAAKSNKTAQEMVLMPKKAINVSDGEW